VSSLRALRDDDRGTTLIEFALVVPVIILLLVGCLDFARATNAYVIVANASREGARFASSQPGQVSDTAILAEVKKRIAPLDPSALTVGSPIYTRTSDARWTAAAPAPWTVTVEVRYDWQAATWLVGSLFDAATGSRTFVVSSTMETIQ
jgi:Flp pilus assembly protein TadG